MNESPGERDVQARSGSPLRVLLEALLIAVLLTTFVVTAISISGDSMSPTLIDGERVLIPRYETWLHRLGIGSFAPGDVVYFPSPDQEEGAVCPLFCTYLIKRIVAVEGDVVEIRRGQLFVNGTPVAEEYLPPGWRAAISLPPTPVPQDHVFVLGDNRAPYGSFDSRAFGPIPQRSIEGRARLVVWPLLRQNESGGRELNARLIH